MNTFNKVIKLQVTKLRVIWEVFGFLKWWASGEESLLLGSTERTLTTEYGDDTYIIFKDLIGNSAAVIFTFLCVVERFFLHIYGEIPELAMKKHDQGRVSLFLPPSLLLSQFFSSSRLHLLICSSSSSLRFICSLYTVNREPPRTTANHHAPPQTLDNCSEKNKHGHRTRNHVGQLDQLSSIRLNMHKVGSEEDGIYTLFYEDFLFGYMFL
ncbi:uncharacterized protein LOC131329398 [Rhododendron vialii]|uniref:uncharacterized protein LOC131329398 n=1 Tax=Rhododendron vialii TaxID=182163 RepID=UPI00265EC33B|nr:uncharacterized protein LOC131329398 [Rhododendron vialii]